MDNTENRPSVLDSVSETQIQELERQFTEGGNDIQYWKDLTRSYGWSEQDSQAVRDWFGQKLPTGGDGFSSQNSGSNQG